MEVFKINETNNDIEGILNEFKQLVKNKDRIKILRKLRAIREDPTYQNLTETDFYNIIGGILKEDQEYFMKKLYRDIQYNLTHYNRYKLEKPLEELERYILENYSFYEGETMLFESPGKVICRAGLKQVPTKGRLYITNYRTIVQGVQKTSNPLTFGIGLLPHALTKAAKKSLGKLHETLSSEARPLYGFAFPLNNIIEFKKGAFTLKLTAQLEDRRFNYSIEPNPNQKPGETRRQALDYALGKLYEIIGSNNKK